MVDIVCDFLVGCGFVGVDFVVCDDFSINIAIGDVVYGWLLFDEDNISGWRCDEKWFNFSYSDPGLWDELKLIVVLIIDRVEGVDNG